MKLGAIWGSVPTALECYGAWGNTWDHSYCADTAWWCGGGQTCVKRRAAISVAMNPNCKQPSHAKLAVERVFDTCFADTSPFDRCGAILCNR